MLIKRCMDCKKYMGAKKDDHGPEFSGISDGLCPKCNKVRLQEIIDLKAKAAELKAARVGSIKLNTGIAACAALVVITCAAYWHFASALIS